MTSESLTKWFDVELIDENAFQKVLVQQALDYGYVFHRML